jgi:hypothetical protein
METDKSQYHHGTLGSVGLIISNTSSAGIFIPFPADDVAGDQTFRFYKKTSMGWRSLDHEPDHFVAPAVKAPGLVIPSGSEAKIGISNYLGSLDNDMSGAGLVTGTLIVQTRYSRNQLGSTDEFVQYSSEFQIGETESIDVTGVTVDVTQARSRVFSLHNNSDMSIWIPDRCSLPGYRRDAFTDAVPSLQRLSDEKTWQIIRASKIDCINAVEPVRAVWPGRAITIDGAPWFQANSADLPAGTYRWDVVFYLEYELDHKDVIVRDGRHIFSKTFEYGQ